MNRLLHAVMLSVSVAIPALALNLANTAIAETYRDRETAALLESDQCGPAFLTERAPISFGNAVSGIFKSACQRHDACYKLKEKSQKWCDDQFDTDLMAICAGESQDFRVLCQVRAKIFANLVRTTIGANSYGDIPAGTIQSVRKRVIPSLIGDAEFEVCVKVLNDSKVTQEYDVTMYTSKQDRVDREPDTYEVNVESGEVSRNICVSTLNDPRWSLGDLGSKVLIHVRADTPIGFAVTNDMVTVDIKSVDVPTD